MISWSKEDIDFLIVNYGDNSNEYLASVLKKTKKSIDSKSIKLGLKKEQSYINDLNKKRISNRWMEKSWSKEEIDLLIQNINELSNDELSKILNR